jgi:uncharacterized protein YlxW (UPF0749 family)
MSELTDGQLILKLSEEIKGLQASLLERYTEVDEWKRLHGNLAQSVRNYRTTMREKFAEVKQLNLELSRLKLANQSYIAESNKGYDEEQLKIGSLELTVAGLRKTLIDIYYTVGHGGSAYDIFNKIRPIIFEALK